MSQRQSITFLQAVQQILAVAGMSLSYREITKSALNEGLIVTAGATPHTTMNARLSEAVRKATL